MWGRCRHLSEREADTTAVTFEFDYLLDPIGPDQAPGASRFAPADAMTPRPGGSNDRHGDALTSDDADAWLIELLTERTPPAATTTLPMPVFETRVDLPPPATFAGLAGLITGEAPHPSDTPHARDVVGSRFATSRTDDDRLPIRRRRRRRSH